MKNDAVYRCKSVHNTAFEELYRNDKDFIYLPRQCLRDGAKALSLLGFLDGNIEFTPLEDRIGI